MDEFWLFFNDGFGHFFDWGDYSHALTLIVLVAGIAAIRRKLLAWVFVIFNICILFAMLLSAFDVVFVKEAWVGFLVPLLILGMSLYDMFTAGKKAKNNRSGMLYFLAVLFGLVQGLSLSNHESTGDWEFLNLVGYFLGLFAAQILLLIAFFLIGFVFRNLLRFSERDWVLVVSALVLGLIVPVLAQNWL